MSRLLRRLAIQCRRVLFPPPAALLPPCPRAPAAGGRARLLGLGLLALGLGALRGAEPLLAGLGPHARTITTRSAAAQQYFNQGLNFYFGFNHSAALRSFAEAARLDPRCALAHWGSALAHGPHINDTSVPPAAAAAAWRELQQAQALAAGASAVEQALIAALARRYANPAPAERGALDLAYAGALRAVWAKFPGDADVGVLFAEALMDLRPWDQWTKAGEPEPGTVEIIATLDAVLRLEPRHPFANHLYIHAVEASPHPERALACADRLRDLQPALAHNVHMPSHIDIRVGHWQDAVVANLKAVAADARLRDRVGPPQGFLLQYIAHNQHMLAYAAMMTGQRALALDHLRALVAGIPAADLKDNAPGFEAFLALPYEGLARFGSWDEILAAPEPPEYCPFARAARFGVRGIALAAKGDAPAARGEQVRFVAAAARVPDGEMAGGNSCRQLLAVLGPMLDGEILAREGRIDEAVARLRAGVAAEDALNYDEPPGWILPVRHSLGATLMAAGRYPEAEAVYREDLARLPENGWSLFGLSRCLRAEHRDPGTIKDVEARFAHTWANADVRLTSSCLCQPGT